MKVKSYICETDDITDPGSHGFDVSHNDVEIKGFVVKRDGEFFAYRNSCPHTGVPLDWIEHKFLDLDGFLIVCALHAARFKIGSGLCVSGPCVGDSLEQLDIINDDGKIYLQSLV